MKAVFDTNILIDCLEGMPKAIEELRRYDELMISRITWMEVFAGAQSAIETETARQLLALFDLVELDAAIATEAVQLRKAHRVKLPDAIIWATARVNGALLITRNTKDFPRHAPELRVPYN